MHASKFGMRQLSLSAKLKRTIFIDKKNFLKRFTPKELQLFPLINMNSKKNLKRSLAVTTFKIIKVKYKTNLIKF